MSYFGAILSFGGSRNGVWWVGLWKARLFLKAPWYEPLFSERYGYYGLRVPLGFGWRVIATSVGRFRKTSP